MSEDQPANWLSLITDSVLARTGPGSQAETAPTDKYKIAGPASAKSLVLTQSSTQDTFGIAESQKPK